MDLWIRTQKKTNLIKVKHAFIDEKRYVQDGDIKIVTPHDDEKLLILGTYATKERALEVLGEIHEHLERQGQDYLLTDENGIIAGQKHYGFVYEMPKE